MLNKKLSDHWATQINKLVKKINSLPETDHQNYNRLSGRLEYAQEQMDYYLRIERSE